MKATRNPFDGVAHVRENAARVKLSDAQVKKLDQAYPVHVRRELPTA